MSYKDNKTKHDKTQHNTKHGTTAPVCAVPSHAHDSSYSLPSLPWTGIHRARDSCCCNSSDNMGDSHVNIIRRNLKHNDLRYHNQRTGSLLRCFGYIVHSGITAQHSFAMYVLYVQHNLVYSSSGQHCVCSHTTANTLGPTHARHPTTTLCSSVVCGKVLHTPLTSFWRHAMKTSPRHRWRSSTGP